MPPADFATIFSILVQYHHLIDYFAAVYGEFIILMIDAIVTPAARNAHAVFNRVA